MFFSIFISSSKAVNAGLNEFTPLTYVDDWLIERKIDLKADKITCRASLPKHATWFGARIRLGADDELIKPIWLSDEGQLVKAKLNEIKKFLDDCRSGFLFLPNNE